MSETASIETTKQSNRRITKDVRAAFRAGRPYPKARFFVYSGCLIYGIRIKSDVGCSYLGLTIASEDSAEPWTMGVLARELNRAWGVPTDKLTPAPGGVAKG